jgi:2-oxoglutarate dehydrogenase E2 component (dihydrolipoamide succinyltransferase)
MPIELKVPEVGESITEVMVGTWKKQEGDAVAADDSIVEIESDKATVELPAPTSGTITKVLKGSGEKAVVGEVIGYMEPAAVGVGAAQSAAPQPTVGVKRTDGTTTIGSVQPPAAPVMPPRVMPSAARVLGEAGVPAEAVSGTGPGGRVSKADAVAATMPPPPAVKPAAPAAKSPMVASVAAARGGSREERYQQAALLTTFNECDMSAVMALRGKFKDQFQERYGVKLGFMSFFVRAAVEALRAVPQVNAEYREPHIVYRDYCDIGIAVGGGKGLVVPVIRNAELLSFSQIEQTIGEFARRASENKLKLEELQGGTFTISNGGVYGSMLSTPIINPPQSGILGLHSIQDRPVALNGQVVIRPMMYLALTYDHRLVDGREAVTFLKRIKDTIEDPSRLMLEV